MAVGAGKFQLYSKIDPVLAAGDYRYVAAQELTDKEDSTADMPIETLNAHVRVRAPRYQLPPDQVLSTFPPAGTEGSYGSRLPQVVIKRRTLPWERDLDHPNADTAVPWMALVLIAEGEGELQLNRPVADCVSDGVTLPGVADSELGNTLAIKQSVVHKIFPTQKDVRLLAHAREVDINDTELMLGDDDGFLSVVIANRLPLAGVDADGDPQPVKYLACLVNLEGQFGQLIPQAPARRVVTAAPLVQVAATMTVAEYDQRRMDAAPVVEPGLAGLVGGGAITPLAQATTDLGQVAHTHIATTGSPPYSGTATWTLDDAEQVATTVYADMAAEFAHSQYVTAELFDPTLRFPVLLHWSFVSVGDCTFKKLMENLDSGLVGTVDPERAAPDGREPLEVVETGHVGLVHRTRRGDKVRTWYRGPLVPHPQEPGDERLPLAHVSDQLRIVIPDGREDLSWASAFEIGRLLALSRPSAVAAMLQWRQTNYHVHRRRTIWEQHPGFLDAIGIGELDAGAVGLGIELGRGLIRQLTERPDEVIGAPRSLVDPGRPLEWERPPAEMVAVGYGLGDSAFEGDPGEVLGRLKNIDVLPGETPRFDLPTTAIRDQLHRVVDNNLVDLVANTLDLRVDLPGGIDPVILGPTIPGTLLPGGTVRPFDDRFRPLADDSDDSDDSDDDRSES